MADTKIEWATKVWNVTRGCRRVSPGCGGPHNEGGCYAERQAMRMSNPGGAYEGLVEITTRGPRWTGKGRFASDKLDEPLRWRAPRDGSRLRVFVDSMSDLFFEEFSNEQIAAVFGVMAAAPQHDFLILTKRPERMRAWFEWLSFCPLDHTDFEVRQCVAAMDRAGVERSHVQYPAWPLQNVYCGVSVEREDYTHRIDDLRVTPSAVRFLSLEPLLGPLRDLDLRGISWVIVGSESGPRARPMDPDWARDIRDQCQRAGVACFVKQIANEHDRKGGRPEFWPPAPGGGSWPREFPR